MFEDFDVVVWATADKEWQVLSVLVLHLNNAVYTIAAFWEMSILDLGLLFVIF